MTIKIAVASELNDLHLGIVEATDLGVRESNADLLEYCSDVAERVRAVAETDERQLQYQQIRQLLRFGKFKATGRSKPAQEYLMRCILTDGALPKINAPVDLLNAVSVEFNLPISLLSVGKCSDNLYVGRGKPGESFIFNSAGQVLDLTDLITVYDCSVSPARPVGTPVKDSMAGKIDANDNHLVAIIYAPNSADTIQRCAFAKQKLADGFARFCQG